MMCRPYHINPAVDDLILEKIAHGMEPDDAAEQAQADFGYVAFRYDDPAFRARVANAVDLNFQTLRLKMHYFVGYMTEGLVCVANQAKEKPEVGIKAASALLKGVSTFKLGSLSKQPKSADKSAYPTTPAPDKNDEIIATAKETLENLKKAMANWPQA